MSDETKLLPCPFCGCVPMVVSPDLAELIHAKDCYLNDTHYLRKDWSEWAAWNRRAPAADPQPKLSCEGCENEWAVHRPLVAMRECRFCLRRPRTKLIDYYRMEGA